ncbi:hypothetical protein BJV74DRAFT_97884 [Russula compacta]|nr:hypothetical protein BJV74DRAFT_97884 [Russula compacta]
MRDRGHEVAHQAVSQAEAKEVVQSSIRSLLVLSNSSDEDRISAFSRCLQVCKNSGLDFSAVLQEPLIEEQTPVYWAILNRPAASSEADDAALDSLIVALLTACGSLNETTMASVRLACMLMSNNTLLQRLFWQFPGLSPLSTSDSMLLRPSGGGDVVDVEQTRDGTGAFVASIKLPRFRLRMSVSKVVKAEFVTSERIWMITFSVHTKSMPEGRSENKWLLSLELANNSTPAWVDADLLVPRRSHQANDSDSNEPIFSVHVGCGEQALQPGHENAIKVRLDEGPMRLHWINEFVTSAH